MFNKRKLKTLIAPLLVIVLAVVPIAAYITVPEKPKLPMSGLAESAVQQISQGDSIATLLLLAMVVAVLLGQNRV